MENLPNYIGPHQRNIFIDSLIHNLHKRIVVLYGGASAIADQDDEHYIFFSLSSHKYEARVAKKLYFALVKEFTSTLVHSASIYILTLSVKCVSTEILCTMLLCEQEPAKRLL